MISGGPTRGPPSLCASLNRSYLCRCVYVRCKTSQTVPNQSNHSPLHQTVFHLPGLLPSYAANQNNPFSNDYFLVIQVCEVSCGTFPLASLWEEAQTQNLQYLMCSGSNRFEMGPSTQPRHLALLALFTVCPLMRTVLPRMVFHCTKRWG